MDPAVNAAPGFFVCHRRKTRIRARRPARAFPGMLKANIVAPEKQRENCRLRSADCRMVSRIARIWRSADQRCPSRVLRRCSDCRLRQRGELPSRVATNRNGICWQTRFGEHREAQILISAKRRAFSTVVVSLRARRPSGRRYSRRKKIGRSADACPEPGHLSLVGGARRAGGRADLFDFVEIGGVFGARQSRRRRRRKLSARRSANGVTAG